jgi:sodium/potassium-transporting ATPase subunit alpha
MDPPREDVPAAVQSCREAGVDITMITGDHPLTAEAIARKCNIITQPTRREVAALRQIDENDVSLDDPDVRALVVTGAMLDETKTEEEWDRILLKDELVFARTTPQQKLQIVSNFQRMKEIVAVTGDGVNDSPALKKADIGVAMGNPDSSDVAREAADVILLNDNFASLVAAIKEGRVLYDNLKKTVAYTLTHVDPETVAVILNLGFGMPLGLGALLVLSIDLLSEQVGPQFQELSELPPCVPADLDCTACLQCSLQLCSVSATSNSFANLVTLIERNTVCIITHVLCSRGGLDDKCPAFGILNKSGS